MSVAYILCKFYNVNTVSVCGAFAYLTKSVKRDKIYLPTVPNTVSIALYFPFCL